jgi:hypothetical protein
MERGTRVRILADLGTLDGKRPWKGQVGTVTHLNGDTDPQGNVAFDTGKSPFDEVWVEWDDSDFYPCWVCVDELELISSPPPHEGKGNR